MAKTPRTIRLPLLILLLSLVVSLAAGCFNIDRCCGVKWPIVANNFMKRLLRERVCRFCAVVALEWGFWCARSICCVLILQVLSDRYVVTDVRLPPPPPLIPSVSTAYK